MATGWQTVARVRTLPAAGRAYLVQDHEPEFFGTSVQRAWAEDSYRHGLYPITAGQWLADMMGEMYGLPATAFDLGIDGERYRPSPEVERRSNVVVAYARSTTPRRGVPVALAALRELHDRRPEVEVWLFGHGGPPGVDFPYKNLGVVPEPELPAIYAEATVGLVLSMTNYSLVAQEMLSLRAGRAWSSTRRASSRPSAATARWTSRRWTRSRSPTRWSGCSTDPALRADRATQGAALRAERTWDRAAAQVETGLRAAIAHAHRDRGAV